MATVEDRQFRVEPFPGGTPGNQRLVEEGRLPDYDVVGTRPIRHDGTDKVTGRARYGADIKLSGLLQGYVLRSPHAHARIVSIDTSKAAEVPGVHAVCTNADMPSADHRAGDLGEGIVDWYHLNQNVLANDKVLYTGHAVAAVAADSVHIAEEAARLIEVEYEVLPPVLDVREARGADAPVLNDDVRTDLQPAGETGDTPPMSPSISITRRAMWMPASPPPSWSSNGSSPPRRFIRDTSSPTRQRRSGLPMARSPCGPAPRAPS